MSHPNQPAVQHPPAGWYPDPEGKPMQRYWNGLAWTEQFAPQAAGVPGQLGVHVTVDAFGQPVSPSSRLAATLLCFFLGVFGVHRFYVGKVGTGILQLVTIGGLGIWTLIDFIMVLAGAFSDKQGRKVATW